MNDFEVAPRSCPVKPWNMEEGSEPAGCQLAPRSYTELLSTLFHFHRQLTKPDTCLGFHSQVLFCHPDLFHKDIRLSLLEPTETGLHVCVRFFDRAVSTMETGPRSCSTLSVSSTPDKSQCRVVLAPFSLLVCSSILHDCPTAVYKATGETRPAT